ncbi:MAG: hypothetical protein JSV84_01560 [Gemmatimonadota bacterium]|nr:MAG: hypothetical protein JSV84_01560 [Gemmatimonadota bacterium]
MKKVSILGMVFAIFVLVAFTHAQCLPGSDDMKVVCIKGEGAGEECCKTGAMGCCKMMGCQGEGHQCMGGCENRLFLCCAQELDLNESQVERLKTLQLEHKKSMIRGSADLEILELELKHLLQESEPNRSAIDNKITAIGDLQTKMKKNKVHARLDAKKVLTKEQLEKCMHGSCGCCGMGLKKVIEHKTCSKEGSCSIESKKYEGHCK